MCHYNTMSSLFIRVDSIITIYDQRNVTPVRNAIRRETNQLDLPTKGRVFPRSAPRVISAHNLILTHRHPDFRAVGRTRSA